MADLARLAPLDLRALPQEQLEAMHDAAATVLECEHALRKSGMSVISEVLRGQGEFIIWERYPKGDIFDPETHSHYFYHSHTPDEMTEGENGHFHLFLRPAGLAPGLRPWQFARAGAPPDEGERFIHIGAISLDGHGRPLRLFTTNRWVTDETLYRAEDIVPLLGQFSIVLAHPNWAVSKWISAMVMLHLPQFEALLHQRDQVIEDWARQHPDTDVLEDRRLQNTSELAIDIPSQIAAIERALGL